MRAVLQAFLGARFTGVGDEGKTFVLPDPVFIGGWHPNLADIAKSQKIVPQLLRLHHLGDPPHEQLRRRVLGHSHHHPLNLGVRLPLRADGDGRAALPGGRHVHDRHPGVLVHLGGENIPVLLEELAELGRCEPLAIGHANADGVEKPAPQHALRHTLGHSQPATPSKLDLNILCIVLCLQLPDHPLPVRSVESNPGLHRVVETHVIKFLLALFLWSLIFFQRHRQLPACLQLHHHVLGVIRAFERSDGATTVSCFAPIAHLSGFLGRGLLGLVSLLIIGVLLAPRCGILLRCLITRLLGLCRALFTARGILGIVLRTPLGGLFSRCHLRWRGVLIRFLMRSLSSSLRILPSVTPGRQ
mmetsp:Transcript_74136/g.169804  ORF Transcript_74136/g.169804 Transcript_74136/m.169804 type:complete len:358 (-) Transcript_74136:59-1132(-)